MSEEEIKKEIEGYVGSNYSIWTIGITDRPEERRQEHNNPSHWHQWDASTELVARRIEKYFLDKGCKGGGGGDTNGGYVYIF